MSAGTRRHIKGTAARELPLSRITPKRLAGT